LIAGSLLGFVLILYMVTFVVRFSDVAVVRTFGKATEADVIREPGFYWKLPWPVQRVTQYDNRIQIATTPGEETPTRDGKNVIVTTTIAWRIDDPYVFSIRCGDLKTGEDNIETRVRNDQKTVIAQYDFGNLVSVDPDELKYDAMEGEILEAVSASAKTLYGIEVVSIGIQKLALPARITETVFDAMKKERQAEADRYTSEGKSRATQIKQEAASIAGTIQSFAHRKAAEIVAEGYRRAAEYNKTFSQDEELAMFLLEIQNLPKLLRERATLVLEANQRPFQQLQGGASSTAVGSVGQPAEDKNMSTGGSTPLPEIVKQD